MGLIVYFEKQMLNCSMEYWVLVSTVLFCVVVPVPSQQGPHPVTPLDYHMMATGNMYNPHAARVQVGPGPPQQMSGAPTPMHQYGQHPQAGPSMPLPTASGTPQRPFMQMYPGGPGIGISHHQQQQMHAASLQHMPNQAPAMVYQIPLSQFSHAAYAAAAAAGHQSADLNHWIKQGLFYCANWSLLVLRTVIIIILFLITSF